MTKCTIHWTGISHVKGVFQCLTMSSNIQNPKQMKLKKKKEPPFVHVKPAYIGDHSNNGY